MDRAKALAVVEDALAEGIRKEFGSLVDALIGERPTADSTMRRGLAIYKRAYEIACADVSAAFPE